MTELYKLTCQIGGRGKATYSYVYDWEMELPDGLTDDQKQLLQRGFGITMRNKFSVYEKSEEQPNGKKVRVPTTHEEKDAFTRAKLEQLKEGKYNWNNEGERETGSPLTDYPKAWEMFYTMKGTKVSGRKVNRKTLRTAMLDDCTAALVNKDPALKDADNLAEQAEALLPAWIAEQEADMASVGGIIAMQAAVTSKKMAG